MIFDLNNQLFDQIFRSSSRVDVANVEPLQDLNSCSRKALVTVVSRLPKRQSTIITATDRGLDLICFKFKVNVLIFLTFICLIHNSSASGSVIRCDVEIDVIDSIEIITTTREIVLEDLPESLEVKAKNEKSICFSLSLN
jgi:hypothetical protein